MTSPRKDASGKPEKDSGGNIRMVTENKPRLINCMAIKCPAGDRHCLCLCVFPLPIR